MSTADFDAEFEKIASAFETDAAVVEDIERQFRVRDAQMRRGERRKGPGLIRRSRPSFFGVTTDAQKCSWCEGEIEAQSRHIVTRHGAMHEGCFDRWDLIDNNDGTIEGMA